VNIAYEKHFKRQIGRIKSEIQHVLDLYILRKDMLEKDLEYLQQRVDAFAKVHVKLMSDFHALQIQVNQNKNDEAIKNEPIR
jgi:hypothetical protein